MSTVGVSPPPTPRMQRIIKRHLIVQELLTTERTYAFELSRFVESIVPRLLGGEMTESKRIFFSNFQGLIDNLDQFLHLSRATIAELEAADFDSVGPIITRLTKVLPLYVPYATNFALCSKVLRELMNAQSEFSHQWQEQDDGGNRRRPSTTSTPTTPPPLLSRQASGPISLLFSAGSRLRRTSLTSNNGEITPEIRSRRSSLESPVSPLKRLPSLEGFLILPIQRIPRYVLLFTEMANQLSVGKSIAETEELQLVQVAIYEANECALSMDRAVTEVYNVLQWEAKLVDPSEEISKLFSKSSSRIVKCAQLTTLSRTTRKSFTYLLISPPDTLLCLQEDSNQLYTIKKVIALPLKNLVLFPNDLTFEFQDLNDCSAKLLCGSAEELWDWANVLKVCSKDSCVQCRQSFSLLNRSSYSCLDCHQLVCQQCKNSLKICSPCAKKRDSCPDTFEPTASRLVVRIPSNGSNIACSGTLVEQRRGPSLDNEFVFALRENSQTLLLDMQDLASEWKVSATMSVLDLLRNPHITEGFSIQVAFKGSTSGVHHHWVFFHIRASQALFLPDCDRKRFNLKLFKEVYEVREGSSAVAFCLCAIALRWAIANSVPQSPIQKFYLSQLERFHTLEQSVPVFVPNLLPNLLIGETQYVSTLTRILEKQRYDLLQQNVTVAAMRRFNVKQLLVVTASKAECTNALSLPVVEECLNAIKQMLTIHQSFLHELSLGKPDALHRLASLLKVYASFGTPLAETFQALCGGGQNREDLSAARGGGPGDLEPLDALQWLCGEGQASKEWTLLLLAPLSRFNAYCVYASQHASSALPLLLASERFLTKAILRRANTAILREIDVVLGTVWVNVRRWFIRSSVVRWRDLTCWALLFSDQLVLVNLKTMRVVLENDFPEVTVHFGESDMAIGDTLSLVKGVKQPSIWKGLMVKSSPYSTIGPGGFNRTESIDDEMEWAKDLNRVVNIWNGYNDDDMVCWKDDVWLLKQERELRMREDFSIV